MEEGEEVNPICFYHRADFDGVCSAAIVKKFVPGCELYGIDYGDPFPWDKVMDGPQVSAAELEAGSGLPRRQVYMVDFSLPPDEMKRLAEVSDLTWIDHHKSALDSNMGLEVLGYQTSALAGCELTWLWFTRGESEKYLVRGMDPTAEQVSRLPEAVRLLGRYDVFDLGCSPSEERFAPVAGWEALYEVSTRGQVRAKPRPVVNQTGATSGSHAGGAMHPSVNGAGYLQVQLKRSGEVVAKQIHRLVAEAFLLNPDGLPEVNHRDGDRTNNSVSNLEWCSRHYNVLHASRGRGVRQLPDGRFDARCAVAGKRHWLGVFCSEQEARAAQESFARSRGLLRVSRVSVFWGAVEAFQFGLRSVEGAMDPTDPTWTSLLDPDPIDNPMEITSQDVEIRGRAILSYRDQEAKSQCADGAHVQHLYPENGCPKKNETAETFEAWSLICLNTLQRGSWQFNSVWDPEKHDAMCVYGQLKDGRWRVSLYSTKEEVDCGAICKALGGGGHKGAAGFICDILPWNKEKK